MKKGYVEGMISIYDIGNVAMLYEPGSADKVFKEGFETLKKYNDGKCHKQIYNNLRFLLHISECILSNRHHEAWFAVRKYLHDFIEINFDPAYSYDWQELKSILFYCIYMRNLKTFENFATNLKSQYFSDRLYLYFMNDSAFPQRKILAQERQCKNIPGNERKVEIGLQTFWFDRRRN